MRSGFLLLVCGMWWIGSSAPATAMRSEPVTSPASQRVLVLKTSDLRSAYLGRAGVVAYDASDVTPESLRRQLQRHFDVVVGLLVLSTPRSLEVALDRLEAAQVASWSEAERNEWRRRLLAERIVQLRRLIEYRNSGRFPLNEGHSAHATPIFVDRHGTACAVGHLMRLAGLESAVAAIQRDNNLVYVPDVRGGAVVRWVLTSGLTIEEAALIQPAYNWPPIIVPPHDPMPVDVDTSFVRGDLRYSNFRLYSNPDAEGAPPVNVDVYHDNCGVSFYCLIGGPIVQVDFAIEPRRLELEIPPIEYLPLPEIVWPSTSRVVIQFDVEVTSPELRIAGTPFGGDHMPLIPVESNLDNVLQLFLDAAQGSVVIENQAATINSRTTSAVYRSSLSTEMLTKQMNVVTEIYAPVLGTWRSQYLRFNVVAVPEPACTAFVAVAFAAIGTTWRRRCGWR